MLERIGLHQTRLRTPGLLADTKGVALGAKGLVLLPTIDRLVAFLAAYTETHSLEDLVSHMTMRVVRSKLGTREFLVEILSESSSRMDAISDAARLSDGFVFTGTSRHFVQYRDRAAPFGYDTPNLINDDAEFALYHTHFAQTYSAERTIGLRDLILRLTPHVDPQANNLPGVRWIVAERGLGPLLLQYFIRWNVRAQVTVAEWPGDNAFDDAPTRRFIFQIQELPERMQSLMSNTPGLTSFFEAGPGVAVELGFRHPMTLRACPVFANGGMVFVRGRGDAPLVLDSLPVMADIRTLARVALLGDETLTTLARPSPIIDSLALTLRTLPTFKPIGEVVASWIAPDEIPLLRKLAYALPTQMLEQTRAAVTARGVLLLCPQGIDGIPLGAYFWEPHPRVYVLFGHELVPALSPENMHSMLQLKASQVAFVHADSRAYLVEESAFVSLQTLLLEASPSTALEAHAIVETLDEPIPDMKLDALEILPGRFVPKVSDA